ncbi:hypothetical protein DSO57_1000199 [Entomophthora muscae]|uniref:Uncharacterized protein n=1 Tax=Entomophthora muscae TaxID=34485 RepID=A0ACC2U7I9_9FUNG|nr:hypothetical protein DSO57_1000199 [Entomophthora muscae]
MQTSKIIIAFCALLVQGAPFQSNNSLVRRGAYGNPSTDPTPANKAPAYESKPATEAAKPEDVKAPAYGSEPAAESSPPADGNRSAEAPEPSEGEVNKPTEGEAPAGAKDDEYKPEASSPAEDAAAETKDPAKAKKCHSNNKEPSSEDTPSADAT